MISCAFCGRVNEAGSRFCIDCGKPLSPSVARVAPAVSPAGLPNAPAKPLASVPAPSGRQSASSAGAVGGAGGSGVPSTRVNPATSPASGGLAMATCPHCGGSTNPALPFCSHCGKRTGLSRDAAGPSCTACGGPVDPAVDQFCARCGTPVNLLGAASLARDSRPSGAAPSGTSVISAKSREVGPKIALLNDAGEAAHGYTVDRGEMVIGRTDGDVRFPDDVYLSPIHAQFTHRDGKLFLRDLGSRNGSWVFLDGPCRLTDGDVILVGSQLLRFRRLGYPGPHPPEADATRRLGSLTPSADVATLQQLRADASVRDCIHLSPIHAQFTHRDGKLFLRDLGSRNGSWVFLDGPCRLTDGDVILVGSQLLRFRRLGYPGPHPPEADATRRLGSLTPSADVATLQQLRADASVRDCIHLSPGRNVLIGRESGDWVFPYDKTMSGRHAEIRSEDSEFYVHDTGSRNGVAVSVRGEREVKAGHRVLLGDQILRVESV
ncbi:MAG TPA: FHA domain-containing protein [Gemmatimonadaceae bacterium]|nr:FHA domain-containing protein [Gemmatimonadaceae bacterium]